MKLTRYKLGEILNVTRGASLSGEFYATEGEYIRLTCGNFDYQNNCFKENKSKDNLYYVGDFRSEFLMEEGDIITPLTEQAIGLLGSTAIIPESGKYIQSQDVAKIICKEELLDKDFAFYLISSTLVKQQLSAAAQQTKIRHTSPDKIRDCTVWIPELTEQKRIGKLLRSLDRKIELNRAINQNLEAMAKQLYDYWFVQFNFPDENGKPYKSSGGAMIWNEKLKREIPKGWNVVELKDIVDANRGISYNSDSIAGGGVPMINLASFNIDGTYKHSGIKTFNGCYSEDKILKPFDLVMCNTQQTAIDFSKDIIGKVFLVPFIFEGDIISSHHVTTIIPKQKELKPYIAYLSNTKHFHKYVTGCCSGTNIMGINYVGLSQYKMEVPPLSILQQFESMIIQIEKLKGLIILENENLIKQRDELLPLLMNGQVSVNSDLSDD